MADAEQQQAEQQPSSEGQQAEQQQASAASGPQGRRRGRRRRLVGRVVNDTSSPGRMRKTIVVEVVRYFRDPRYGKYVKRRKKYHAHDEREAYRTGDVVEIRESRPLSRTKRWVAVRLIERPPEV